MIVRHTQRHASHMLDTVRLRLMIENDVGQTIRVITTTPRYRAFRWSIAIQLYHLSDLLSPAIRTLFP